MTRQWIREDDGLEAGVMSIKNLFSLLLVICVFWLVMAGQAYSAGYNTDSESTSTIPHGGYTTTGNKCKSCHAVHLSEASYRLLRPGTTNAATACEYCHGQTGIVPNKRVWIDANGHGLDAEQTGEIVVPDDTTYTAYGNAEWGCVNCHSPHASNLVVLSEEPLAGDQLLRKFPNPNKPTGGAFYDATTGTLTLTQWCSNCHEANYGLHTDAKTTPQGVRYGHDSSRSGYELEGGWVKVAPDDGSNKGPTCQECHTADSAPAGISKGFPHAGGASWKMLKASSSTGTPSPIEAGKMDKLCASEPCHDTTDLP